MRRFLSISLISLALVTGAAGVAPAAHAQYESAGDAAAFDSPSTQNPATPKTAATPAAGAQNPTQFNQSMDSAYDGVMVRIMGLFAWLVGVAAITLDNAVYYTVVTMGKYVNNLTAVGVVWRILRDIGNIILIFGFLAVGISTILNTEKFGWGTKMLPTLLISAVFLNFSLFISEAVVDTGNLFATQFYTQINGGNPAGAQDLNFDNIKNATSNGISSKIMGQLGLQSIYGKAVTNTAIFSGANPWFIGFMGILLFLVTAFVMFSLSFILISRFVILIFVIIIAPIGFAGYAIPKLSGIAKQWKDMLIEQTITAPILLLLLYIALAVITDVQFLTGFGVDKNTGWDSIFIPGGITGFAGLLLSFLVAMGLLLSVVVFSKKLGAIGADWASKTAGKLSFGATAFGMRSTVGWGANKAARGLRNTRFASIPLLGTGVVKGLDRAAKGSFDVRGTGALKNFPGGGINAGQAQKGGYRAELKERIGKRTSYAAELTGRGLTGKEKESVALTEKNLKKAQEEHNTASTQMDSAREEGTAAVQELHKQEAEVGRLEKEEEQERQFSPGGVTRDTGQKLEVARKNLTTSQFGVRDAELKLQQAQKTLQEKATVKTKAEEAKEAKENEMKIAKSNVGAQAKYAKNLQLGLDQESFFNKYINLAANTDAAKEIIKRKGKKADKYGFNKIQELLEKSEEKESGGKEEKKENATGGMSDYMKNFEKKVEEAKAKSKEEGDKK
ncbi:MAG: hypothetical protein NTU85_00955 [Candidatus Kaiserbacteria bacterium]|nr:hypothetical protein [Candidatus Kaiserbacteria bacterium]